MASPATPCFGQSCMHWAVPPGWRKPHFLQWGERCHWTHLYIGQSSHHLLGECKPWHPSHKSSYKRRCNTGKATRAHPVLCACRWRSSPADWCRISILCRLSQTPSLWKRHRPICLTLNGIIERITAGSRPIVVRQLDQSLLRKRQILWGDSLAQKLRMKRKKRL